MITEDNRRFAPCSVKGRTNTVKVSPNYEGYHPLCYAHRKAANVKQHVQEDKSKIDREESSIDRLPVSCDNSASIQIEETNLEQEEVIMVDTPVAPRRFDPTGRLGRLIFLDIPALVVAWIFYRIAVQNLTRI